jgi:AraC family transcriptional regulator
LDCAGNFSTRLGFYLPGGRQAPHVDDLPGISIVITGAVQEEVGAQSQTRLPAWIAVKPPGVRHSAKFSPSGAIVLSVSVADAGQWELIAPRASWEWRRLSESEQHLLLPLNDAPPLLDSPSQLTCELLSLATGNETVSGTPPAWLTQLAERLTEEPQASIHSMASQVGVHPVYLARAFRRWYGVAPSEYRLRAKTSRALANALFHASPAAEAANKASFADQSHMCRSIRSSTGVSLSQLRAYFQTASRPTASAAPSSRINR